MSRLTPGLRSTFARFALAACLALASARSAGAAVDCSTANCVVDFLFVIDNSVSMGSHQASLAQAAEEMVAQLATDNIDWRVAVTYTDFRSGDAAGNGTTCAGTSGPGSHVLCPFTRDMHVFRDGAAGCAYANPGTCGGGAERGFSAARAALTRLNAGSGCEAVPGTECNLRPDANLVLIFVSDTGEQTNSGPNDDNSVTSWADYFASQGVQVIHGINCPIDPTPANPAPCGDGAVPAEAYQRYRTIIAASSGVEGSILDSDFGDIMREIINAPENTGTTTTTVAPNSTTTTSTSTTTTTTPGGSVTTTTTPGGSVTTTTTPGGSATTTTTTPGGSATTTTTTVGGSTTSTTTVGGSTTSTTTVGGSTTSTTLAGGSTTTTVPGGSTTTTTVTQPTGSTTTTTLPGTGPECTPATAYVCDDGDACTNDSCSIGGRCQHESVKGFDAITCRLPPTACGDAPARMLRKLQGARGLIVTASTASSTKKTNNLVVKAARIIKAASIKANKRVRRGKLSSACASQISRVLLETQSRIKR